MGPFLPVWSQLLIVMSPVPHPSMASPHGRGRALLSPRILERCETGRNLIGNCRVYQFCSFLSQTHPVTLILLWFNLVFIPKVGAQRMLPASQEHGRINESLLGKHLQLLRWNKQHHFFLTLWLLWHFPKRRFYPLLGSHWLVQTKKWKKPTPPPPTNICK